MNRWETLYMYVFLALFFILYHIQTHTHTIHIKIIIKPFSINMEQHVCNVILVLFFLPFFATDLLLCKKKYVSYCWCTLHNNIEDGWKHNRMSCLRSLHKLTNRECKKKIILLQTFTYCICYYHPHYSGHSWFHVRIRIQNVTDQEWITIPFVVSCLPL